MIIKIVLTKFDNFVSNILVNFIFGDGKLIFSIKKNEKNINKRTTIILITILVNDRSPFDRCNLGCIIYRLYLNLKLRQICDKSN